MANINFQRLSANGYRFSFLAIGPLRDMACGACEDIGPQAPENCREKLALRALLVYSAPSV